MSNLTVKNKIEAEKTIKVAAFKKDVRKTKPHKHNNYFEIIYLSKGSGYHGIDLNKYAINPPVMFFVKQEQVHHWDMDTEPDGFVVIIKKSFVEKSLDIELKALLLKVSRHCCLQVSDNSTIEKMLELLTEENRIGGEQTFRITEGLLKSLLAKVLQVSKPLTNKDETTSNLYHAFIQLLVTGSGIKNQVADYANQLNTSPQNLNAACRKAIGQSASAVLSGYVLDEAKRLLLYTGNTVSEIALALNFVDPSHFVKYFKKHVATTPHSFRRANQ